MLFLYAEVPKKAGVLIFSSKGMSVVDISGTAIYFIYKTKPSLKFIGLNDQVILKLQNKLSE